jgi:PBP1b-binding outer membrane lipoprotein LpoB
MSLVDTATNRVVWEDEKTIVKQGNQNQVGF